MVNGLILVKSIYKQSLTLYFKSIGKSIYDEVGYKNNSTIGIVGTNTMRGGIKKPDMDNDDNIKQKFSLLGRV